MARQAAKRNKAAEQDRSPSPATWERGLGGEGVKRRRAFTLLETLVALIIFTVITFALAFALSSVLRSQSASQRWQEEAGVVRAVFGSLSRDLQASFISKSNPATLFMMSQTGGANGAGGSLTFSTLAHRIDAPGLEANGALLSMSGGNANSANQQNALPQSNIEIVRYDFDPVQGVLRRLSSPIPNLQTVLQTAQTPDTILAENVAMLTLRFWDADQKNWRNDWQYQPRTQTQEQAQDPMAGLNPDDPTGGQAQPQEQPEPDGDRTLPDAVEITLVLKRQDGATATYTTLIPIVAPMQMDLRSTGANPAGGNAPGGGGQGNQQNGGGNNPPGGGGAPGGNAPGGGG